MIEGLLMGYPNNSLNLSNNLDQLLKDICLLTFNSKFIGLRDPLNVSNNSSMLGNTEGSYSLEIILFTIYIPSKFPPFDFLDLLPKL